MEQFRILYYKFMSSPENSSYLDFARIICDITNTISEEEFTKEELCDFLTNIEIKKRNITAESVFDFYTIVKEYEYLPMPLVSKLILEYELEDYELQTRESPSPDENSYEKRYSEMFMVSGYTKY